MPALSAFFIKMDEKKFRASQVMKWLHQSGVDNFEAMTNLGKGLRQKLSDFANIPLPEVSLHSIANDGTQKWVLQLSQQAAIETVFIPEKDRGTICISTQVGCPLDCDFCATGKQGFNRNLNAGEIIAQMWIVQQSLIKQGINQRISNVVFMGMGEPLLNFDNTMQVISILRDDFAYGLSRRRITISTAGIVPAIEKLTDHTNVCLALSLHAPTNELRDILVPINKKYPLEKLIPACKKFAEKESRRRITIEYAMLKDVNDSPLQARQLVKLLANLPVKMNLIPFNPFPGTKYQRSTDEAIDIFQQILIKNGLFTIARRTRGSDIDAACGQLVGNVENKAKRQGELR